MTSLYGSTFHKRNGIEKQDEVFNKLINSLKSSGFIILKTEKATLSEDMHQKFDYKIMFDEKSPFGRDRLAKVLVDIKYGKTFTLKDNNGNNTLAKSNSDYIVYNFPEKEKQLLIINTKRLKECLKNVLPKLYDSYEEGNKSQYFYIENYIKGNQKFLETYYTYIELK